MGFLPASDFHWRRFIHFAQSRRDLDCRCRMCTHSAYLRRPETFMDVHARRLKWDLECGFCRFEKCKTHRMTCADWRAAFDFPALRLSLVTARTCYENESGDAELALRFLHWKLRGSQSRTHELNLSSPTLFRQTKEFKTIRRFVLSLCGQQCASCPESGLSVDVRSAFGGSRCLSYFRSTTCPDFSQLLILCESCFERYRASPQWRQQQLAEIRSDAEWKRSRSEALREMKRRRWERRQQDR